MLLCKVRKRSAEPRVVPSPVCGACAPRLDGEPDLPERLLDELLAVAVGDSLLLAWLRGVPTPLCFVS